MRCGRHLKNGGIGLGDVGRKGGMRQASFGHGFGLFLRCLDVLELMLDDEGEVFVGFDHFFSVLVEISRHERTVGGCEASIGRPMRLRALSMLPE